MAQPKPWTSAEAKRKIQAHFNRLAGIFNSNRRTKNKDIAACYGDLVMICALRSRRVFRGQKGAVDFWTWMRKAKNVKKISLKVQKVALRKAQEFILKDARQYENTLERYAFVGRMTYNPEGDFGGDGDHLGICDPCSRAEYYDI
ncbi:MAG: hypothetical protein FJY80_09990 [Candidatus Aminicenantes bacterium]|nr:hypothetical protein [Candidatus Aminicenantes bacterium]